jgi:hypothetical protein
VDCAVCPCKLPSLRSSLSEAVNEEEFDSLRRWGDRLADDSRPEVRAAGKAISLLAAEVERLQVELWHRRLGVEPPQAAQHEVEVSEGLETEAPPAPEGLPSVLGRLASAARRLQPDRLSHRG